MLTDEQHQLVHFLSCKIYKRGKPPQFPLYSVKSNGDSLKKSTLHYPSNTFISRPLGVALTVPLASLVQSAHFWEQQIKSSASVNQHSDARFQWHYANLHQLWIWPTIFYVKTSFRISKGCITCCGPNCAPWSCLVAFSSIPTFVLSMVFTTFPSKFQIFGVLYSGISVFGSTYWESYKNN